MNPFTFTYSFSDSPEVFTTTVEASTLTDAFSVFYERSADDAFGSVPTIHDIYYDARELANNDNTRVYLNTSYDQVETHGPRAMYDPDRKQWYITGSMYQADTAYWDAQGIDRWWNDKDNRS